MLTRSDPNTVVKTLNQLLTVGNERIIFSCVAGSRAYGTQVAGSDEDIRGIYMVPSAAYLPIEQEPVQLSDDRNNTVYYSLRRCIELLVSGGLKARHSGDGARI